MKTYLYFFEAPGRIKIGISKNVRQRLKDVGAHMEVEPKLIDAIPGGYDLEKFVHERLSVHRIKGEWFTDTAPVREVIDILLRDGPKALGYKKQKRPVPPGFVPAEKSPEEWLRQFNELSALMWPDDPAGGLAAEIELSPDLCRDFLSGARPVPPIVKFAFGALLMRFIGDDLARQREQDDA